MSPGTTDHAVSSIFLAESNQLMTSWEIHVDGRRPYEHLNSNPPIYGKLEAVYRPKGSESPQHLEVRQIQASSCMLQTLSVTNGCSWVLCL